MAICKSFNQKTIAKDVINTLAKYRISVGAIDIIFDEVKELLKTQVIFPISVTDVKEWEKFLDDAKILKIKLEKDSENIQSLE